MLHQEELLCVCMRADLCATKWNAEATVLVPALAEGRLARAHVLSVFSEPGI